MTYTSKRSVLNWDSVWNKLLLCLYANFPLIGCPSKMESLNTMWVGCRVQTEKCVQDDHFKEIIPIFFDIIQIHPSSSTYSIQVRGRLLPSSGVVGWEWEVVHLGEVASLLQGNLRQTTFKLTITQAVILETLHVDPRVEKTLKEFCAPNLVC